MVEFDGVVKVAIVITWFLIPPTESSERIELLISSELFSSHVVFLSEEGKPSIDDLKSWIDEQNPIGLLHVHQKTHFVLLVGYDTDPNLQTVFYVNGTF